MVLSFIYLVGSRKYCWFKIRTSTSFDKRFRSLQQGVPFTLEPCYVISVCRGLYVEQLLHKHFHASRLHGEWFTLTEAEVVSFPTFMEVFNFRILNFRVPTRPQRFWQSLAEKRPQAVENARQFQQAHPEWCPETGQFTHTTYSA